ncbi:hypothetical protein FKW77_009938 [Venturia effusa]|uniref:Uncharacterized protein n=1 Tax=Venturia effusa TaxID=50376 RepID=A0A517L256_9PEZI|nr:hypothetical protein FKW77_009938 [Venturia effusa]
MKTTPIIAIVGPTGIGKTKLGVSLAKFLDGEVISVDSLQVYRDGGIMTAKPTLEEMDGIKHHLIDYLDANEEPSSFVELSVQTIRLCQTRRKVPILVGGSMSLTRPLLFHPFFTRQELSVIILDSDIGILGSRLDARVEQMAGQGLLQEAQYLHDLERELLKDGDFSTGIWKAIGYPELRPCFGVDHDSVEYHHLVTKGLALMKTNTRLYAAAQLAWIRTSLIPAFQERGVDYTVFNVGATPTAQQKVDTPRSKLILYPYFVLLGGTVASSMYMMGRLVLGHKTWFGKG